MFPEKIRNYAMLVSEDARERRVRIVCAESCTGGLLAGLFTEFAGSSEVLERGYVTYSNRSKEEILGVPGDLIADYGAVSEPVVRMMADGALEQSRANLSIAITGVAGPGGGTKMKPVGTIHLACARENKAMIHEMHQFIGMSRFDVRMETIFAALQLIQKQIA